MFVFVTLDNKMRLQLTVDITREVCGERKRASCEPRGGWSGGRPAPRRTEPELIVIMLLEQTPPLPPQALFEITITVLAN